MFWTDKKLRKRVEEVKNYRYRDIRELEIFEAAEDEQGIVNPKPPSIFDKVIRKGDTWEGRDRYLWLRQEVVIPSEWKGKRVLGFFDFGKTGEGNTTGFESLLYMNGKPYQGVDSNHQEVFFREEDCGKQVSLVFRLWSGLEGGGVPLVQEHRIKKAFLAWLDEAVDDFYYLGIAIVQTLEILQDEPEACELRKALNEACLCVDWSCPGSLDFYESIYQADSLLNQRIDKMDKHSMVKVSAVGHTHIDMAWLWRLKHTREKASRSFSTVLRLMEMFPEYVFLQTQPQIYAYIKEDFPDIYAEIKRRVQEGRWEVDGAMWVEADCNLTSGESLTRQIFLGSRFMKEEFGKEPEYLWLPDVFGYSWALPQILKKSGIETFMTTKISWNQYNRMPHDTFMWKGIDGTEILTHFITTPDPDNDRGKWYYTYNGLLTPETVKGVWDNYQDKDINRELLICYGYGDGGGGVSRDHLENRRRIDRIPGLPQLSTSTAGEYFRKLNKTVRETGQYVHTWDGELYLEYHRGTYTSQGYIKRMNRKMELLYRRAEWLTAMGAVSGQDLECAQQEDLTYGWYRILTNQFHDIIPGSSIHEVYEDARASYSEIKEIAARVEGDFAGTYVEKAEHTYVVYNDSSWKLTCLAEIPSGKQGVYVDASGKVLPSQTEGEKTWVLVPEVPSMGMKEVYFRKGRTIPEEQPFCIQDKNIETPWYVISLNEAGQIERLYDKEANREVLPSGARANVLQVFEDKPLDFEAWDIDIFYQEKMKEITNLESFEVKECGPLRLVLAFVWRFGKSVFSQEMILYANSRRIDFVTRVDFQERRQLVKAAFPVDIRANYATYDIQYGNVRRPNHWNTSWEQAKFESVGHRFADLSERDYGVSLLNDCKYGYDVKGNVLRLSLLRSGMNPDYLQDVGYHEFTYSLLPHKGDFVGGKTVQEAHMLNSPAKVLEGKNALPYTSFLSFDCEGIEMDAVKKSEDGRYLVVRFHEFTGSRQNVCVKTGFVFKTWMEGDLRERPVESARTDWIKLTLRPYEIKTILFEI
ncbi:alpha-mannosidase [Blautia schinkii]|nr:alpha-mannosidase [Blautia schinkii]